MAERRERRKKKSPKKFTFKMQKKLVVLYVLVLLAFAGLSARLIWINKESGEKYKKQVLSQQRYDSITLPFKRGDILDKKGTILAASEKVYNLVIDSGIILSNKKYMEPTMNALDSCFDLNMGEVRSYVESHPDSNYYVPLKQLTYEEIKGFKELEETGEQAANIAGVWFEEEYKRRYPGGSLACDVIGFTSSDNNGMFGLEEYYNDVLNGTAGREYGYLNDDSELERTIKAAVDGNSLVTTIDANIQGIAEKYILEFNEAHRDEVREGTGSNNTACIIMEVNTGNILAMASYPNYDLNHPKDLEAYYANGYFTEEEITAMKEEGTELESLNGLWRNFCISDAFEPGSTAKPFTVAMGLESGKLTGNESYECRGVLEVGGHQIHCHNRYGDGVVTVAQAVEQSCNVALMKMGATIGKDIFAQFQRNFNFGLKTNIDLVGEARTVNSVYTADKMGPAELATATFGQGFTATMIQMVSGFCSLINGGYYYEPHMVSKIISSSGATVTNIEPRILKQTISASTSEKIIEYCNGVVTNGTGHTARPAGYAIGGKTGTAQTLPRGNGEYIVSFMGYAPANDPQIIIYTVVDRPNAARQDEAKYATILTRNILSEVLPYLGIFMTEELSEAEMRELEEKQLEITNQYRQPEEPEEAPEGEDGTGEDKKETGEGTGENDTQEGGDGTEPIWKTFPIDPDTGYAKDPTTGELVDPATGDAIENDYPALEQ